MQYEDYAAEFLHTVSIPAEAVVHLLKHVRGGALSTRLTETQAADIIKRLINGDYIDMTETKLFIDDMVDSGHYLGNTLHALWQIHWRSWRDEG